MNMRQYQDRERIAKEASSKTLNLRSREIAAVLGVPVPKYGSPSANWYALLNMVETRIQQR